MGWIRSIFRSRADRLFYLFLLASFTGFILSTVIPIWMIAVSPLVLGVPHLFSGMRYLPRLSGLRGRGWIWGLTLVAFGVAWVRVTGRSSPLPLMNDWEIIVLLIVLVIAFVGFTAGSGSARTTRLRPEWLALLAVVLIGSWHSPLWTLSCLAFSHHLIAFVFWYRAAALGRERAAVLVSFTVFVGLTILIFFWGRGLFGSLEYLASGVGL